MAAPYILARTLKDAHAFGRNELGLERGRYRVVNTSGTLKSIRGVDLHLVVGWKGRFDYFQIQSALRWTRMNVIDHEQDEAPAAPDDLEPAGEQLLIPVSSDEAAELLGVSNGDNMISEGGPVTPEPEPEKPKNRRRSRCKDCGNLHYRDDPCPDETMLGGD